MVISHQIKSEDTEKCRFLIKRRIEVKVSWLDTPSAKGNGNNRQDGGKYPKEGYFKQYFLFF